MRSTRTCHSREARSTQCSKTMPQRKQFPKTACDGRSFRSFSFMYSSWQKIAQILSSAHVYVCIAVRVANVLPNHILPLPPSNIHSTPLREKVGGDLKECGGRTAPV